MKITTGIRHLTTSFWQGHPAPLITIDGDAITLNVAYSEAWRENFTPPVPKTIIVIDKLQLKAAIQEARQELLVFSEKLIAAAQAEGLDIPDIDKLLVWGE